MKIVLEVDDKGSVTVQQFGKDTEKAFDSAKKKSEGLGGSLKAMQAHWLAVTAATAVVTVGFNKVKNAASDLQETQGKFDVVFEGQTQKAEAWAQELRTGYAMSERAAKANLAAMQDLLVPMGMAKDEAGEMSIAAVKLAADLGSFNNLPTEQVMADIQSALVGNYETMKKYGVVVNAELAQEKALAMGLADTKDALTAADKAQAAYQLIVEGSTAAIGDMARTMDGAANQEKVSQALLEDTAATLGGYLLPAYTDLLKTGNEWIRQNEDIIKLVGEGLVLTIRGLGIEIDAIQGMIGGLGFVTFSTFEKMVGAAQKFFELLSKIPKYGEAYKGISEELKSTAGYWRNAAEGAATYTYEQYRAIAASGQEEKAAAKTTAAVTAGEKAKAKATGESTKERTKAELDELDKQRKAHEKFVKDAEKIYKDLSKEYTTLGMTDYEKKKELLNQEYEDKKAHLASLGEGHAEYADGVYMLDQWLAEQKKKLTEEHVKEVVAAADKEDQAARDMASKKLQAYRDMYDSIDVDDEEHMRIYLGLIEQQRTEYETLTGDKVAADAWAKQEIETAWDDFKSNHGTFIEAIKADWDIYADGVETALNERIKKDFNAAMDAMTTGFQTDFVDVMVGPGGKIGNIETAWETAWGNMVEEVISSLADMVLAEGWDILVGAGTMVSDYLFGSFKEGSWKLGAGTTDSYIIEAHAGEMIIPADVADKIRNGLEAGGVSDFSRFSDALEAHNPDVLGAFMSGTAKQYGALAALGTSYAMQGVITPEQLARAMISPEAVIASAVMGGVPSALAEAFSVDPAAQRYGTMLGMAAAMALGMTGPAGMIAGVVGMLAVDAIMDAYDLRAFEDVLDKYEDVYGKIWGGRIARFPAVALGPDATFASTEMQSVYEAANIATTGYSLADALADIAAGGGSSDPGGGLGIGGIGGMSGMDEGGGGYGYGMAGGGLIGEHVIGRGVRSGASYEFAEGDIPEIVLPGGSRGVDSDEIAKRIANQIDRKVVQYVTIRAEVITTDDIKTWLSRLQRDLQEEKYGDSYERVEITTRGLS